MLKESFHTDQEIPKRKESNPVTLLSDRENILIYSELIRLTALLWPAKMASRQLKGTGKPHLS